MIFMPHVDSNGAFFRYARDQPISGNSGILILVNYIEN